MIRAKAMPVAHPPKERHVKVKKARAEKHRPKAVAFAIEAYEKVHSKYFGYISLKKYNIPNNPQDKYYKIFLKIVDYLLERKGGHKNPIDQMLRDYYESVFEYYASFDRKPYLSQLSPSIANQIRFDEFIEKSEKEFKVKYFVDELHELEMKNFEYEDITVNVVEV